MALEFEELENMFMNVLIILSEIKCAT